MTNHFKLFKFKMDSLGDSNGFVIDSNSLTGLENGGKVNLVVAFSDGLVAKGYHAGNTIKQIAQHIKGGGGGQPHLATAGGKDAGGIEAAFNAARDIVV